MKSHIGEVIYRIVREKGMSLSELAREVPGMSVSKFSKLKAGRYTYLNARQLCDLARELAPDDPRKQASVVCAYLWDMCPRDYLDQVSISPDAAAEGVGEPSAQYGGRLQGRLASIAKAYSRNDKFRRLVDSLADVADGIVEADKK